ERVQSRQRSGKPKQADGAGEEEEGASRDGGDGPDVEREAHPPSVVRGPSESRRELPFFTKAMEANVASSARVNATSTVAVKLLTAPSSSNAAMPPVPISCAAIMRSASPGPRRMRTSPSASIATMKPSATGRNSVIADRPRQRGFLCGELRRDRLIDVEAVVYEVSPIVSGRYRTGHQARECGEYVAKPAGRNPDCVGREAGVQRQPPIERGPRPIDPRDNTLMKEAAPQARQR